MTDAERKIVSWAEALYEITKGGAGEVIVLRSDGASFQRLFQAVREMREGGGE